MSNAKLSYAVPLAIVGVMGTSCILMDAIGMRLRKNLNARKRRAWVTANKYQLTHTAALAALLGMMPLTKSAEARRYLHNGFYLMLSGAVGFSGSIYALCLQCPNWVGPITPTGGLILILGWISAGLSGIY